MPVHLPVYIQDGQECKETYTFYNLLCREGIVNLFCSRPDSKYFQLCGSRGLCLLCYHKCNHRQMDMDVF